MSVKKQGFASLPEDRLKEVTSEGGKRKNPNKGFGSLTPEQRSVNAAKGAAARWARVKAQRQEQESEIANGDTQV